VNYIVEGNFCQKDFICQEFVNVMFGNGLPNAFCSGLLLHNRELII
jgi:hypothetical protein